MSDILSPADARQHLRGGDDLTDEQLDVLIAAAEAGISDFLGRPLIDADLGWATVDDLPPNIVHAVKVVLTELYDDRATPLADMAVLRNLIGRYVIVSIG